MGYNNDQYPPQRNKKRKLNWLIPVMLGVIIGVLLSILAVNSNIMPIKEHSESANKSGTSDNKKTGTENFVSLNVTSQITDIVDEVSPAVVGVTNLQHQANFWQQQEGNEAGTGSGVIYKREDGHAYIVTNHHVIEGADEIEIVLSDETTIEAELLGSDLFSDLAVLRASDKDVKSVIEMGSSDQLKVGEPAIAIGNPLGHMFSGTVTQGIISGTQRTIPLDFNQDGRADWQAEVIQTDAAINPGNSGGALINIEGQLIGINSMKINEASVEGIGFAIPIDVAGPIIKELETIGKVTRPFLGVEIYSLEEVPKTEWKRTLHLPDDVEGGVYIWSIEPLSPAEESGLKRLDVITALDDKEIINTIDLRKVLYEEKEVGDEIRVTYYRDGKKHETTINLSTEQ